MSSPRSNASSLQMRQRMMIAILSLSAGLYSAGAGAYAIWNKTGMRAHFMGENCPGCFDKTIDDGDWGACPGNRKGCRGETEISFMLDSGKSPYYGNPACAVAENFWLKAPVKVTAQGVVHAYQDHVEIWDDNGRVIYHGPWDNPFCRAGGWRLAK